MSRLRYIKGSEEAVAASPYVIHEKSLEGYFEHGQDKPLHLEIGMGKGRFIMDMARLYPGINFIGVERYESVLLRALQKYERAAGTDEPIKNLKFLCVDAALLPEYFGEGSVDKIYLNFSDPWPKERHAHRRLVSEGFLRSFAGILKGGGTIEFKTDNTGLFDFALTRYESAGYELTACTRDLHGDAELCAGNVMTEYEEKFSGMGNRICKMIIKKVMK